jgi:hypothetical protein
MQESFLDNSLFLSELMFRFFKYSFIIFSIKIESFINKQLLL